MNYQTLGEANAFPGIGADGLTKREYFAAMAMQGFNSVNSPWRSITDDRNRFFAQWAVEQADALIAALNAEKHP